MLNHMLESLMKLLFVNMLKMGFFVLPWTFFSSFSTYIDFLNSWTEWLMAACSLSPILAIPF